MECSLCKVALKCQARADLTYYECPLCGGIWFNSGELENLVSNRIRISPTPIESQSAPPDVTVADKSSDDCPSCGQGARLVPMAMYATRHAHLRGCPVCFGRWLSRDQAITLIDRVCYRGPLGWLHRLLKTGKTRKN